MEDAILNGPLPLVSIPEKSYQGATVRFNSGGGCCTTTYSYGLSREARHQLAKRVAAALNATRHLSLEELEAMVE